jgi:hypothetical protein
MEKLLELANQFELEREKWIESFKNNELPLWKWYVDSFWDLCYESEKDFNWEDCYWDTAIAVFISKHYWFIKWLIDNYYIELPMWLWVVKSYDKESWLFNYFSDYESLLMLLSIQEKPIEFLIKLIQ